MRDRLRELIRVTHRLAHERNLSALLAGIMDAVIRLSGAERGFLVLRLEGQPTMTVAHGLDAAEIESPESQVSRAVLDTAMRTRKPVLCDNAQADAGFAERRSVAALSLRSVLCAPIQLRGAVSGAIYLDHRGLSGAFAASDLDWIEAFCDHVALAIENAFLYNRATVDRATGLSTRGHFLSRLETEVARARRDNFPVALLLFDLDGLRLVNDLHGFAAGNRALAHFGAAITRELGEGETGARVRVRHPEGAAAGRLGGDEFAVCLPDAAPDAAARLAARLLEQAGRDAPAGDGERLVYTVSAGVAVFPLDAPDADALLLAADEALYRAKRAGRHRVHVAGGGGAGRAPEGAARPGGVAATDPDLARRLPARDGVLVLGMLARVLAAGLDPTRMLDVALGLLLEATGAERGFVMVKGVGDGLRPASARNFRDEEIAAPGFEVSSTIVGRVFRTGRPFRIADPGAEESLRAHRSIVELRLASVLAAPITLGEEVLGVIYLDTRSLEKELTAEDEALVTAFAERIAAPVAACYAHQQAAAETTAIRRALADSQEAAATKYEYKNIVGRSRAMRELLKLLDRITDTAYPVLISGEAGTGKELVARALHYNGPRRERPFLVQDCAAPAETLLESELFGQVRGAFAGAPDEQGGLFAAAAGGTLFLDEVANLPAGTQARLLRVLQEGQVRPGGGHTGAPVDVRVVAATQRDLAALVAEGRFREDLYYRLGVFKVQMPPLRERREDIPALVGRFLARAAEESGTRALGIEPEALKALGNARWPGNVQQLENEVRRLAALSDGTIRLEDLTDELRGTTAIRVGPGRGVAGGGGSGSGPALVAGESLEEAEQRLVRELLMGVLDASDWNCAQAARTLRIGRSTLYEKMRALGIKRP
ncbi:MAG: sigma 54-interacting transcriptional regulator [Planctomycetes bacterium]|nr:sigma 54-interacting transcriptional regulator [Planctomycetota bacterium]